jgi:hypothetical protein
MVGQHVIDEVEEIKTAIDWSWATIARRLDWSSAYLAGFRSLKQPMAEVQLQWLRNIRAAIEALPPPGPESFMMQPQMPQDVKVMLLEDIAAKLVDEYFALDGQDASPDETAGARYMVGRLAERCGVADEVREAIRARQGQRFTLPVAEFRSLARGEPAAAEAKAEPEYPGIGSLIEPRRIASPFAPPRMQRVPMED